MIFLVEALATSPVLTKLEAEKNDFTEKAFNLYYKKNVLSFACRLSPISCGFFVVK
jgi:hypothetical protein